MMKKRFTSRIFLTIATYLFFIHCDAQNNENKTKILGDWIFERYDFIDLENDTARMNEMSQGLTITFESNGRFTTKTKHGAVNHEVVNGTYKLSSDGKYIHQNGEKAEVIKLNNDELVLKLPEVVIHLRRHKQNVLKN